MENQRLSKVLAQSGVASRRKCEELIFEGNVQVNKETVTIPQTLVNPDVDHIQIHGRPLKKTSEMIYIALHKPKGYVCSHNKVLHGKVIYDLLDYTLPRLFTCGRLDKDSTGLILLTNDGHFAQKAIHPSSDICKEYEAKTGSSITEKHIHTIAKGMELDGSFVKPVSVVKTSSSTLTIVIKEGKNREIRRLLEHVGLETIELSRVRIGGLKLLNLPCGRFKFLSEEELKKIFTQCF